MKMINKKFLVMAAVALIGIWPLASYGGVFVTKEEDARTTAEVNDDLYIAGNSVTVEHNVQDDLFGAANSVEVTGDVGQDIYAAGNSVRITGEVGDDVFAAGNSVRVTTKRADDVFAAGNVVEIVSDNIQGSVYTAGQKITISGKINGSVQATGETVKVKSGSEIKGDLVTYGPNEPVIEEGVAIGGETKHVFDQAKKAAGVSTGKGLILGWVMSIAVWAVVALVGWYVGPALVSHTIQNALQKSGKSLGFGFVWVIALIPVSILLMISMVGWPLAVIGVLGSAAMLMVANAVSMIVVGVWVMQKIQKKETPITWQHVLIGTVVVKTVQIVPIIGWLISLVIWLLTAGALGMSLWEQLRPNKHEPINKVDAAVS